MWHRLLCFVGLREDSDWAPPFAPEVNHPYQECPGAKCCEHCGAGKRHSIHQEPFDRRRAVEVIHFRAVPQHPYVPSESGLCAQCLAGGRDQCPQCFRGTHWLCTGCGCKDMAHAPHDFVQMPGDGGCALCGAIEGAAMHSWSKPTAEAS